MEPQDAAAQSTVNEPGVTDTRHVISSVSSSVL